MPDEDRMCLISEFPSGRNDRRRALKRQLRLDIALVCAYTKEDNLIIKQS